MKHLQKNGSSDRAACGDKAPDRTWNLVEVDCPTCQTSDQYTDSEHFGDLGSKGREV